MKTTLRSNTDDSNTGPHIADAGLLSRRLDCINNDPTELASPNAFCDFRIARQNNGVHPVLLAITKSEICFSFLDEGTDEGGRSLTLDEFDEFCESLPHTTHVVQWGDAHVWKIGGKVFAVGGWSSTQQVGITFKCTPETFRELKGKTGLRPAPYLASRGMTWLQWLGPETMTTDSLIEHLWQSYRLVAAGLTKSKRSELGIDEEVL